MKPRAALLVALALPALAPAAEPAAPARPRFQLELLPRSLQKNPLVDVNVITELTPSGRTQPPPTAEAPVDDSGQAAAGEADDLLIREMVERARLVGGDRFATELVAAISAESQARRATPTPRVGPTGSVATQPNVAGSVDFGLTDVFSPLERFRNRDDRTRNFMEDIGGSIHFVVASAYDAASVAANRRVLLWRTKMTVRTTGLGLAEALPPLIATAGPFFGRDMAVAESIRRRLSQTGTVELGPMEVQGYDEPRPAPGPTAPPTPPPLKP